MPRKNSYITVTDQFCGAGGSSQGVRKVSQKIKGVEVKLALNHWKLAIETHNTNFPDTLHDCTDISACDPRRYPSTDILITSPECTTHSPAGGNTHKLLKKQMDLFDTGVIDPATERSRATMWDVCRFAEYHQYNAIIVENVVEAKTRWALFDVWLMAMHKLGYNHKCVYLNSMHCHPTPQSRDRMYVVFWKKGNTAPALDMMPRAYCLKCTKDVDSIQAWKDSSKKFGKYRQQYVYACPTCSTVVEPYYYASFNAIDWSDRGTRIGDRPLKEYRKKKTGELLSYKGKTMLPLSPNTLTRADYGLEKYGNAPYLVNTDNTSARTPVMVRSSFHSFSTQTTAQATEIFFPYIIEMNRTGEAKPSIYEAATITSGGINHAILQTGVLVENKGQSKARSMFDPISPITCTDYHGILTGSSLNGFLAQYYNGSHCTKHLTDEFGSVTCKDRSAIFTYEKPALEDCYYRMIKPKEVKLAMAFDHDYIVLGNGKYQVRQLGNAVTPPAMEWLVNQVIESLN